MRPLGFPRQIRLVRAKKFALLHKRGRRDFTASFIVYSLPNGFGFSRLAVSISARAGGAVDRNRLKRLVREFFRINRTALSPPVDMHITIKRGISVRNIRTLSEIEIELSEIFKAVDDLGSSTGDIKE